MKQQHTSTATSVVNTKSTYRSQSAQRLSERTGSGVHDFDPPIRDCCSEWPKLPVRGKDWKHLFCSRYLGTIEPDLIWGSLLNHFYESIMIEHMVNMFICTLDHVNSNYFGTVTWMFRDCTISSWHLFSQYRNKFSFIRHVKSTTYFADNMNLTRF
jgi:hypothetical protein